MTDVFEFTVKHSMSTLADLDFHVEVDRDECLVTLAVKQFDSVLICDVVTRILPLEHDVIAFANDQEEQRPRFRLRIRFDGQFYGAQVVKLFNAAGPCTLNREIMLFLDTEFTDLERPTLLSLGMVTLEGREHYVELNLYTSEGERRVGLASDFVKREVLPMWGRLADTACSASELGRRTGEWLLALQPAGVIRVGFDYAVDWELTRDALETAGMWEQLRERLNPVDVLGIAHSPEGEIATSHCFDELRRRSLFRHHALADAIALKEAYLAVNAMREALAAMRRSKKT